MLESAPCFAPSHLSTAQQHAVDQCRTASVNGISFVLLSERLIHGYSSLQCEYSPSVHNVGHDLHFKMITVTVNFVYLLERVRWTILDQC